MIEKNIRKYRNHKHCKNEDNDDCILWSACDDCFYHEKELICPYCERIVPNKEHLTGEGCKWCQKQ